VQYRNDATNDSAIMNPMNAGLQTASAMFTPTCCGFSSLIGKGEVILEM
jgi:hypothetical protein